MDVLVELEAATDEWETGKEGRRGLDAIVARNDCRNRGASTLETLLVL